MNKNGLQSPRKDETVTGMDQQQRRINGKTRFFAMEKCFGDYWLADAANRAPIGTLRLGEAIAVETPNARNIDLRPGMVVEEVPKRSRIEGYGNAVTGPFFISGIRSGDWIAVHIEDVKVSRYGYIRRGGPFLNRSRIVLEVCDERVCFPGDLSVPIRPMVGTLGVIPRSDSRDPGPHGGNLDLVDIRAGSVLHMQAQRDGGYLFIGDCHAIQGEGEITCTGVEIDAIVQLRIERSPGFPGHNPVLETQDEWQTIGIHADWSHAVRIAFAEMVELVRHRYGISDEDANVLVGTVGHVRNGCIAFVHGLCLGASPGLATVAISLSKNIAQHQ